MSMPRDPVFHTGDPAHNLIPAAGSGVWYPLHDSLLLPGISGLPTPLTENGTPSGSKWGTPGVYTFPATNTDCSLQVLDDATNLYLSSQLSLYPAVVDSHYIIAMDASYEVAPSTNSYLFTWGKWLNTSCIALDLTSSQAPRFAARGKGSTGGGGVTQLLTAQSGTFSSFRAQGVFSLVLGIRMASSTTVDIELRLGNGTLSAYYAYSGINVVGDGTDVPGISGGVTMSDFGGLMLGARNGSTVTLFWGSGANATGKIGNFSARRFDTYSASRVTDALAYMVARKRDFPRNLCTDYS